MYINLLEKIDLIISWRIHIIYFMFSQLLDCDDLFVVFESESFSLAKIMMQMMNLIKILHGKCIHNWFGHEKTKWLLRWYIHWNKIEKNILILCFFSLNTFSLDIIVLPWRHRYWKSHRTFKSILIPSIYHISIYIIHFGDIILNSIKLK